jgi:hypothetical protein
MEWLSRRAAIHCLGTSEPHIAKELAPIVCTLSALPWCRILSRMEERLSDCFRGSCEHRTCKPFSSIVNRIVEAITLR